MKNRQFNSFSSAKEFAILQTKRTGVYHKITSLAGGQYSVYFDNDASVKVLQSDTYTSPISDNRKRCNRCNGGKHFNRFNHIQEGVCFQCHGTGFVSSEYANPSPAASYNNGLVSDSGTQSVRTQVINFYHKNRLLYPSVIASKRDEIVELVKSGKPVSQAFDIVAKKYT
ncbi:hypothetical protein [Vibrio genomosp. F6]|uniref:Uncharacterized protein n=1 Tax=Vibrio genomosp. F6 str. FF-238 TaxID=1191298 RepID=A0A1E5D2U2_9VIBR|nr:hypothetical protein [Vibrio genomosp. F6]OEE77856.1 hypothetical protein A130_13980 [Vibrio genomosp. F6 str. FF-238]